MNQFIKQLFLGYQEKEPYITPALKKQKEQLKQMWIGKNYPDYGIERIVRLSCVLSNYLFPTLYIRHYFGEKKGWTGRKMAMDGYTLFNLLIPVLALIFNWHRSAWAFGIVTYFTAGTISYIINLVVLKPEYGQPSSYLRSIMCIFINFIQLVAYFGFAYQFIGESAFSATGESASLTFDSLHAFYYSFVVSATLGFGDITPISTAAILVTILQSFLTILFMYLILTTFIAHIGKKTYYNDKQQEAIAHITLDIKNLPKKNQPLSGETNVKLK